MDRIIYIRKGEFNLSLNKNQKMEGNYHVEIKTKYGSVHMDTNDMREVYQKNGYFSICLLLSENKSWLKALGYGSRFSFIRLSFWAFYVLFVQSVIKKQLK
jgi:hypothetical protein